MNKFWKVFGCAGAVCAGIMLVGASDSSDNVYNGRNTYDVGSRLIVNSTVVPVFSTGFTVTGGPLTRASQVFQFVIGKLGASGAGWTVNDAASAFTSKLPASQTAETLVIPITGDHVGDIITAFYLVGQVEGPASGTFTLDADLRKQTAAAAAITDASVGAVTQISLVDAALVDTILSATNAGKTGLSDTIGADESFYVLLTGTTPASCDVDLMGVHVVMTQK